MAKSKSSPSKKTEVKSKNDKSKTHKETKEVKHKSKK